MTADIFFPSISFICRRLSTSHKSFALIPILMIQFPHPLSLSRSSLFILGPWPNLLLLFRSALLWFSFTWWPAATALPWLRLALILESIPESRIQIHSVLFLVLDPCVGGSASPGGQLELSSDKQGRLSPNGRVQMQASKRKPGDTTGLHHPPIKVGPSSCTTPFHPDFHDFLNFLWQKPVFLWLPIFP